MAAIVALALVGTACDDDNETTGPPIDGPTFSLRVIHASPDAPSVDIWAEGLNAPIFTDVSYGETTGYLDIPEGTYNIQIRAAGSAGSTNPVYETGDLTLTEGQVLTALAAGFLNSQNADDEFRVLPFFEDFADAGSMVRVRIVHASPDAPTVAIDVGNDGTPELNDLQRFGESGPDGVELPAGQELQIGIWAGSPLQRVTAFTTPQLPAGGELFVIATGSLAKLPRETDGFSLLAVAPTGTVGFVAQNPTVYALHAGPDAPAVDIFVGDTELVDNISFAELSDGVQVPPGMYTLEFFPTSPGSGRPGGPAVVSLDTPMLDAGQRYIAVATGFLAPDAGEEAFQLLAYRDDFAFDALNTRARAVHASPDAPAVDIGTVTGTTISAVVFENLAFADASEDAGQALPEASLTLGVAATGTPDALATFDVTTAADLRAFTIAIGALAPDAGEEGFRLLLVNTSAAPWTASEIAAN
jgi:hypothetical protein